MRPILATESRLVKAIDTLNAIRECGIRPAIAIKPATPAEKIWNGVRPAGAPPFTATAPTIISEITPSSVSRIIEP